MPDDNVNISIRSFLAGNTDSQHSCVMADFPQDAAWKRMQKNTFTRWANEHLKKRNMKIDDIVTDLSDGLKLAALVEVLAGKKFPRMNQNPKIRTHKLENVTKVITFLEEEAKLRLVSIDSSHIVDCNEKLILGLMWSLIAHYNISQAVWEGEQVMHEVSSENAENVQKVVVVNAEEILKKELMGAKQRLLAYIGKKLPNHVIKNFTSDWNSGIVIGALVDACAPGLCPDWSEWTANRSLQNATEAIDAAEQWLDIPQLIHPHEMIDSQVDERAMMTYLSQFPAAKLKAGAPLRPKTDASKAKAYGPGLNPTGNTLGHPCIFTVDTIDAGRGSVEVIVLNPKGGTEPCNIVSNKDNRLSHTCTYTPRIIGLHRVIVKFANREVPNSPFQVNIDEPLGDPAKVQVHGPGIEYDAGNCVGKRTYFNVLTEKAGRGKVDCTIIDPSGRRDSVMPSMTLSDGRSTYLVEYTPKEPGVHQVELSFAEKALPKSPYRVSINQPLRADLAYVTGRGVQEQGIRVGEEVSFLVHTEQCGRPAPVSATLVRSADGAKIRINCEKVSDHVWRATYTPTHPGIYDLRVRYGDTEISENPFKVEIGVDKDIPVVAFGHGLHRGRVDRPNIFTVVCRGASNKITFLVKGPSEARLDCVDNNDATIRVTYWVTEPGEYALHVLYEDEDIKHSPFMPMIDSNTHDYNPGKLRISGPGVGKAVTQGKPVEFTVENLKESMAPSLYASLNKSNLEDYLWVKCYDNMGNELMFRVNHQRSGKVVFGYTPIRPGFHTVEVVLGDIVGEGVPFVVNVLPDVDLKKVRLWGTGLKYGSTGIPMNFYIDVNDALLPGTSRADLAAFPLSVMVTDDLNRVVPVRLVQQSDGSTLVDFIVDGGASEVHIMPMLGDKPLREKPVHVTLRPNIDVEKIRILGLENDSGKIAMSKRFTNAFHIHIRDKRKLEFGEGLVKQLDLLPFMSNGLAGKSRDSSLSNNDLSTHTEEGIHAPRSFITSEEKDLLISRSKWRQCDPDNIAASICAIGSGLEGAEARQLLLFTIDSRNVPSAHLSVTITGPCETEIVCVDNHDGTCDVSYQPSLPGLYIINIVYDGEHHIAGSPFFVPVYPVGKSDMVTDAIRTYGPGVTTDVVFVSAYIKFTVDASTIDRKGDGEVRTEIRGPGSDRFSCNILNNKDGTYTCNYTPLETGPHKMEILYEGVPLSGSPFPIDVISGYDAGRVTAEGPGVDPNNVLVPGEQTYFTVDLTGAGQGGLRVVVEGPSNTPIECQDNQDGTCTVLYTPSVDGDYQVFVRLNETLIPKMPVTVRCRAKTDASQVQCYGPGLESGNLRVGWPAYFTVDTKKAGEGVLQVNYSPTPDAPLRPAEIQPLGSMGVQFGALSQSQQYYHKVTFTPEVDGMCRVEVLYDGVHVLGSPFDVRIRKACDPDCIRVYGAGVGKSVPASLPTTFTVDAREAGIGDLTLIVTDPKGHRIPVRVFPLPVDNESVATNGVVPSVASLASGDVTETGLLSCTYEPDLIGTYTVRVLFAGVEVGKKPFKVKSKATGHADLCRIESELNSIIPLGLEQIITLNIGSAGKGRMTCQVTQPIAELNGSMTVLPVEIEDHRNGTISVYYTPKQLGELHVELRFGGNLIPKGAFTQKVLDRTEFDHMMTVARYRPVEFRLPTGKGNVIYECTVIRPSGTQQLISHTLNNDQTVTVLYEPTEQGMHQLHVNYYPDVKPDNVPLSSLMSRVQGSPYRFFVDSISTGRVTAHGPGLSHGFANKPAEFLISAKDAGGGGLFMSVEGPSNAEITSKENGDGTCSVSYLPLKHGQYTISIKFNGEDIVGSPFSAYISEDVSSHSRVYMGTPGDFEVDSFVGDVSDLVSTVQSPSGIVEACILKRLPNNRLGISFTPKATGKHVITVLHGNKHIQNSPFRVHITENEIGTPDRVKVIGPGVISGRCNQVNTFTVDTREAGYSNLDLSVVGPSKAEIECSDNNDGTCTVKYIPVKKGEYTVTVKYAGQNVPGSPFTVMVVDETTLLAQQTSLQCQEFITVSEIGSRCELSLYLPETRLENLSAVVTTPSSEKITCDVILNDLNHYIMKFSPREIGQHLVSVNYNGVEIQESPFAFSVGAIADGAIDYVRATGPGLNQGYANQNNEIEISTKDAGSGTLAIVIEGPSKALVECEERGDGLSTVNYRVEKPGTYSCSIKFNDCHIKNSPFQITVRDRYSPDRIHPHAMQHVSATPAGQDTFKPQIGRPVAFNVHHEHQADQVLQAVVYTPANLIESAEVLPVEQDEYSIRFVPRVNGPHLVHIHTVPGSLAMKPDLKLGPQSPYPAIPGSPFRLVISQYAGDPGLVYSSGAGLSHGIVGEENFFLVHTAGAGSGVLNMTMNGPSKVSLLTQEHVDGYVCRYIAPVPGHYELHIKYGGDFHIPGSPFKVNIVDSKRHSLSASAERAAMLTDTTTRKSGAEYVQCHGMGLRRAIINHPNYFTMDASFAGSGFPKVTLCGPNRINKELDIRPQEDNRFSVSYLVSEPGEHMLLVKWNEEHVPGSPFAVEAK